MKVVPTILVGNIYGHISSWFDEHFQTDGLNFVFDDSKSFDGFLLSGTDPEDDDNGIYFQDKNGTIMPIMLMSVDDFEILDIDDNNSNSHFHMTWLELWQEYYLDIAGGHKFD